MQVISKTRPRKTAAGGGEWPALSALNEGEVAFLVSKSERGFYEFGFSNPFTRYVYMRMFNSRSPCGRQLWLQYWPLIQTDWVRKHPGRRPAAFWYHGTADADTADWADLRERAMWSKSKQRAYLKRHSFLLDGE